MGRLASTVGRLCLAAIFLLSGLQKLQSFDAETGGPTGKFMAPKLDHFIDLVQNATGVDVPLQREHYASLVLVAAVLEVGGGLLFLLGSVLGSVMLMMFLMGATPVMHNFWDLPVTSPDYQGEVVHFLKNLAIFGGILAYTAKPVAVIYSDKNKNI